ncbi:MAG: hypothetical protein Q4B73_02275 [Lachnospiraceae bacterium]|nr:hypothetical protein [Lachnospiraceae bacterium]
MIDENRVKSMIRLAAYENGEGGKDLAVRRYSCRDYVVLSMVRTFFMTTVGYILLVLLIFLGNLTAFMERLNDIDIIGLVTWILVGYAAVLAVYLVITVGRGLHRYQQAERSTAAYEAELKRLKKATEKAS